MKVYLTGATGFLGRPIAERLLVDGHDLTVLALPNEVVSASDRVRVIRGDVTRPDTLAGSMDGLDAVVHLAGAVGYGVSWDLCRRLNIEGTANIAVEASRAGVRRFFHMSSVSVYGRVSGRPIDEDSPLKKIGDPYGDTKIDAEAAVREAAAQAGMDLTVIRPTVIYGPGDRLFLPKLVENLKSGRARIIGSGENRVDLIHVRDVADFMALILRRSDTAGRTYNLANPENPTWKELLTGAAGALGLPPPDRHIPYPLAFLLAGMMELISKLTGTPPRLTRYAVRNVGRPYDYRTDRMTRQLGFHPSVDLVDGIREFIRRTMNGGEYSW